MTHLAAVHVFNGRFSEREIDVISVSERTDEIRSCRTATPTHHTKKHSEKMNSSNKIQIIKKKLVSEIVGCWWKLLIKQWTPVYSVTIKVRNIPNTQK
jgi:hypothetical protein